MKTLDRLRMAVLGLSIAALAGCGGGGGDDGSSAPPTGPTELKMLFTNLPDGTIAMPVATDTQWLFDFSPTITADAVAPFVELRSAEETVPVTVDVLTTSLRVRPARELRLRTDYTLTFKAGMKAANGATLGADIVRRFRTILFDGIATTVSPGNGSLENYPGQRTFRIADVNGDGRPDIVQIGGDVAGTYGDFAINIFLQNADHSFSRTQNLLVRESQLPFNNGMGELAVIDLDHDGVPEIVVGILRPVGYPSGLLVFKQDAGGQYAQDGLIETTLTDKLLLADIDRDGRPDLVVFGIGFAVPGGGPTCGMVTVLTSPLGARLSSFTELPCGRLDAVIGNLERPGQLDLVLYESSDTAPGLPVIERLSFYTLDETGRPTINTGLTVAAANICAGMIDCYGLMLMDVNGDGVQDLLFRLAEIAEQRLSTLVYVRNGAAGYQEYTRREFGSAFAFLPADADGDGRDDLLVIVQSFGASWVGLGLSEATPGFELSHLIDVNVFDTMNQATVAVGDLDGDGLPDVVMDSYNSGLAVLFLRGH